MPLNPFVAAAAITAGTMALPFAIMLGATGLGLSTTAVLASTVTTKVLLACGGVAAKAGTVTVVKSITVAGLVKKTLVTSVVVGAATIVVMTAQTPSEEVNGELPLTATLKTVSEEDNGELPWTVNVMGPPADD